MIAGNIVLYLIIGMITCTGMFIYRESNYKINWQFSQMVAASLFWPISGLLVLIKGAMAWFPQNSDGLSRRGRQQIALRKAQIALDEQQILIDNKRNTELERYNKIIGVGR